MKKSLNKFFFHVFAAAAFMSFFPCAPEQSSRQDGPEKEAVTVSTEKAPHIASPVSKDVVFRQFEEDALYNARKSASGKAVPLLTFYTLTVPENMDFIWLSSRLSPLYKDTLATLNRLSGADADVAGKKLKVCSFNGIFVPSAPKSAWEQLLYKKYITDGTIGEALVFIIDGEKFYFFIGSRFDPTTSLFFLDAKMVCPLKSSVLTSDFGYRVSPISGTWKFHSGVDLAAPSGSDVYACKAGTVSRTGFSTTYGNYIEIQHYNGMTSFYAHLSKVLVGNNQKVDTGAVIGKVGTTGASTGPHLHFELKKNGKAEDPGKVLSL